MKKNLKVRLQKGAALCLVTSIVLVLGGCGGVSKYNSPADTTMAEDGYYTNNVAASESWGSSSYMTEESFSDYDMADYDTEWEEPGEQASGDSGAAVDVKDNGRKLIRTVDMNVETKEFDKVLATLEDQVNQLGGYIESMDTYNGSRYSGYSSARNANMVIRIPQTKLQGFLDTVSDISNVVRRSDNVEDVTLTYVDLESHKQVLQAEHDRLLGFLEQAETIEDMLTIEQRLSNIRYQLESMEAQLRTFDNKVDYSTIYLNIDEVKELTVVVEEEETTWQRISGGFMESLEDIGDGFKEFGIWVAVNSPYMVLWIVVFAVIIVIIRVSYRRSIAKKAKKQAGKNEGNSNAVG